MATPPVSDADCIAGHRARQQHRTQEDAAKALGISRESLQRRLKLYEERGLGAKAEKPRVRITAEMQRSARSGPFRRTDFALPMSESAEKFHEDWGPEECIAELRRIAEADPERVVTRNFFRNESRISEATWNRFFGTFEEFKRQAGITLSRHQHRLERAIAKHASADTFRAMNLDKAGWEDAYRKPHGRRFQTVLVGTDIHDRSCDPFWRACFIDAARRAQPEKVVLNGDVFDLPEFGKYPVDPRTWDVVGRIKWVHEFLADLREVAPDAEIIFVEGNHEYRLMRHLAEATPAMRAVLSDLHGWTVPKLLGLDAYEVNYIARMDLSAFTERDVRKEMNRNYVVLYDALLGHHFPEGRNMGLPGWNGHHHKHVVWPTFSPSLGASEWHQIGCGHARKADYCDGEKWSMGILLAHVDTQTKATAFEYVEIKDFAVIGGRWYARDERAAA